MSRSPSWRLPVTRSPKASGNRRDHVTTITVSATCHLPSTPSMRLPCSFIRIIQDPIPTQHQLNSFTQGSYWRQTNRYTRSTVQSTHCIQKFGQKCTVKWAGPLKGTVNLAKFKLLRRLAQDWQMALGLKNVARLFRANSTLLLSFDWPLRCAQEIGRLVDWTFSRQS